MYQYMERDYVFLNVMHALLSCLEACRVGVTAALCAVLVFPAADIFGVAAFSVSPVVSL